MKRIRARWVRPVAFAAVCLIAVGCSASQANGNDAGKPGDSSVAAKVGDVVITTEELDAELAKKDTAAVQAYYDARKRVLDQMITQKVVDAEVAKQGITEQELQTQITSKVAPVTDAEVQAFYAQNQAQMGGRTLEQMGPQVMQYLTNQRISQIMSEYVTDLKKKAGVRVMLDPPRADVKVAANDPKKGPEGAPITLVEFSDFQ